MIENSPDKTSFSKTSVLKMAALVAAMAVSLPGVASATYLHHHHHGAHHYRMLHQNHTGQIHADGHCNGRVDGTGLRHSCGTATGGPVGGLPNRN